MSPVQSLRALAADLHHPDCERMRLLCEGLAEPYALIVITDYDPTPGLHEASGQRVRTLRATANLEGAASARVTRRIGTDPAGYYFTGYEDAGFRDYYEIRFSDGTVYGDELWRPAVAMTPDTVYPGDLAHMRADLELARNPDFIAWWLVDPLKNRIWQVYLQRLIDGLPIVG